MDEWLSRTRLLFGDEPIKRLKMPTSLSWGWWCRGFCAAEMVASGIGALTIIDGDRVREQP